MELNKRIKALTDIQSVTNGCHDWEFMTKKGYFANSIFDFKDLKRTCVYGEYAGWREHNQCFHCEVILPDGTTDYNWFSYFLPEDSLLPKKKPEKKYRPFTLNEFQDQFHFGICIILRPKKHRSMEFHLTYNGYKVLTDRNIAEFYLGPVIFTLSELFDEFERFENGRWWPFGIEVKDEE